MSQWSLQFEGIPIKKIQEEMIAALSDTYDAFMEFEEEMDYLSGIWKGGAANIFFSSQKELWQETNICAEKSEKLLMGLMEAEKDFAQGEKEIKSVIRESFLWGI